MVGEDDLRSELEAVGIEVDCSVPKEPLGIDGFNDYEIDANVQAVVVGLDRDFTYNKLCIATLYVQKCEGKERLPFICTDNQPNHVIQPQNRVFPGTGSIVDAI